MNEVLIEVSEGYEGERIDKFLSILVENASRNAIQKLIENEKVLVNIEKYGNTTSATIPMLMFENQHKFKKGDNLILTAFGAGFTWGAVLVKWAI
jgi:3-oxoacyl-[acyl-carrier-protein] synthase III